MSLKKGWDKDLYIMTVIYRPYKPRLFHHPNANATVLTFSWWAVCVSKHTRASPIRC